MAAPQPFSDERERLTSLESDLRQLRWEMNGRIRSAESNAKEEVREHRESIQRRVMDVCLWLYCLALAGYMIALIVVHAHKS